MIHVTNKTFLSFVPSGGAIVNISSIIGQRALPEAYTYCASKAAVDQLTRSMAVELGPHGIRVNAVLPTTVSTTGTYKAALERGTSGDDIINSRTPLNRSCVGSDIANAVLFLLTDKAAMISGNLVQVDGGFLCT